MTVNTTDILSGPYLGDDINDTFEYDFRIQDESQLAVYEVDDDDVETILDSSAYTVTGIGVDTGGEVTRSAGALPTGYKWYIRADYKLTQLTPFSSQGAFFPVLHEDAMDKLTFITQQLEEELGRTIKVNVSSDFTPGELLQAIADAEESCTADAASASASETNAATSANESAASAAEAAASAASIEQGLIVKQTGPTGAAVLPSGTTAQRPATPLVTYERYNTTLGYKEVYNGSMWVPVPSDTDLDDKADKTNVLELDNTTSFTPDADYEPATKKYVDDNSSSGTVSAVSTRTTTGTWTISGLTIGVPLIIGVEGTGSGTSTFYFRTASGADSGKNTDSSREWGFRNSTTVDLTSPSTTLVPTATTVVLTVVTVAICKATAYQ